MLRSSARRILAVSAAASAMIAPSRASWGYAQYTTDEGVAFHWRESCVSVTVYPEPFRDMTADATMAAAQAAADAWMSASCSDGQPPYLRLTVKSASGAPTRRAYDARNQIIFMEDVWCLDPLDPENCHEAAALAITTVMVSGDGHLLDADIEVNAYDRTFADVLATPQAAGADDLQNTLTHELGHFFGLDHTCFIPDGDPTHVPPTDSVTHQPVPLCVSAPEDVLETTMAADTQAGETRKRDLTADDVAGFCATYPSHLDPKVCITGNGCGCATGSGPGDGAWSLALLLALGGLLGVRRTARREE